MFKKSAKGGVAKWAYFFVWQLFFSTAQETHLEQDNCDVRRLWPDVLIVTVFSFTFIVASIKLLIFILKLNFKSFPERNLTAQVNYYCL